MTHEYKHKVDLNRYNDQHMMAGIVGLPDLLAYARELEERNKQLEAALRRIMDHGMPSESDTTQTWLRCSMSVYRIARDALDHGGTHD